MFSIGNNKYQAWLGSFENDLEVYVKAVDISGNEAESEIIVLKAIPLEEPSYQYQFIILIAILSAVIVIIAILLLRKVK
jgi:hypothetical protein